MIDYEIEIGRHRLGLGRRIAAPAFYGAPATAGEHWDIVPGAYSVDGLVKTLDLLLEAVVRQLGRAADREALIDGLEAAMSIGGSESVLPLDALALADPARVEIAEQARRIGVGLAARARRANGLRSGEILARPGQLENLRIRSPCEGYRWTGSVVGQLMGPAGGRNVMQLYNEWLHQFVLLRDGLLSFTNWEQVPLVFVGSGGMRMIERSREVFVAGLRSRRLPHAAIVALGYGLFADHPPDGAAYGFQAAPGLALPAVLGSRPGNASQYLLTWHPAGFVPTTGSVTALLPKEDDYPSDTGPDAANVGIDAPPLAAVAGRLVASPGADGATVALALDLGSSQVTVDLGQILRGHRNLHRPRDGLSAVRGGVPPAKALPARSVLRLERPVHAGGGVHIVGAGGDPLVALALLGKIRPENVVVRSDENWAAVFAAGNGNGGLFVLDMDAPG